MSNHMEYLKETLGGQEIRAAGEAMGMAVAVTAEEIWTGYAGTFRRWGAKTRHFPLATIRGLDMSPNPTVGLLQIEFGGEPSERLVVMYREQCRQDFEQIAAVLRAGMPCNGAGGEA